MNQSTQEKLLQLIDEYGNACRRMGKAEHVRWMKPDFEAVRRQQLWNELQELIQSDDADFQELMDITRRAF